MRSAIRNINIGLKSKFTFQVVSDLHLEIMKPPYPVNELIECNSDVLILAGDIGHPNEALREWLVKICDRFKAVVYVPGNHEYYQKSSGNDNKTMTQIDNELRSFDEEIEGLYVLNPGALDFGEIVVVGASLWSHVPKFAYPLVKHRLNDYRMIYSKEGYDCITIDETNELHSRQLQFITSMISSAKKAKKKVILCTHHAPMILHTSPDQYQGAIDNPSIHAFATDIQYLFKDYGKTGNSTVEYAIYGHTHHNQCSIHHGTCVYSNQRGYGRSKGDFTGNDYSIDDVKTIQLHQ